MKQHNSVGYGSLFIGDLPKYCQEEHIEHLFSAFGPVVDIKIKRSVNETRTITYAFVAMANVEVAENAKARLDGQMFMGRILRVNWAFQHTKGADKNGAINSIYVRYSTPITDRTITNQDLHQVFLPFGHIEDVSIKESFIDHRGGSQYGYGFVHFSSTKEGVQAAFQAVKTVHKTTMNRITFTAELSRNLLKQFEAQNRSPPPAPLSSTMPLLTPSRDSDSPYLSGMASTSGDYYFPSSRLASTSSEHLSGHSGLSVYAPYLLPDEHAGGFHSISNTPSPQSGPATGFWKTPSGDMGDMLSKGVKSMDLNTPPPTLDISLDSQARNIRTVPPLPPKLDGLAGGRSPATPLSQQQFLHRGMMRSTSPSPSTGRTSTYDALSRVNSNCSDSSSQVSVGSVGLANASASSLSSTGHMIGSNNADPAEAVKTRLASLSLDTYTSYFGYNESSIPSSPSLRKNPSDDRGGIALPQYMHNQTPTRSFPPPSAPHQVNASRPPIQLSPQPPLPMRSYLQSYSMDGLDNLPRHYASNPSMGHSQQSAYGMLSPLDDRANGAASLGGGYRSGGGSGVGINVASQYTYSPPIHVGPQGGYATYASSAPAGLGHGFSSGGSPGMLGGNGGGSVGALPPGSGGGGVSVSTPTLTIPTSQSVSVMHNQAHAISSGQLNYATHSYAMHSHPSPSNHASLYGTMPNYGGNSMPTTNSMGMKMNPANTGGYQPFSGTPYPGPPQMAPAPGTYISPLMPSPSVMPLSTSSLPTSSAAAICTSTSTTTTATTTSATTTPSASAAVTATASPAPVLTTPSLPVAPTLDGMLGDLHLSPTA